MAQLPQPLLPLPKDHPKSPLVQSAEPQNNDAQRAPAPPNWELASYPSETANQSAGFTRAAELNLLWQIKNHPSWAASGCLTAAGGDVPGDGMSGKAQPELRTQQNEPDYSHSPLKVKSLYLHNLLGCVPPQLTTDTTVRHWMEVLPRGPIELKTPYDPLSPTSQPLTRVSGSAFGFRGKTLSRAVSSILAGFDSRRITSQKR
jgi:hypothetical protein